MDELSKIHNKYPNHDFIEIKYTEARKMAEWVIGETLPSIVHFKKEYTDGMVTFMENNGGFVQFLDKGVLVILNNVDKTIHEIFSVYKYEFKDKVLIMNFHLTDPQDQLIKSAGTLYINSDLTWTREATESQDDLVTRHVDSMRGAISGLGITDKEYLQTVVMTQIMMLISINTYLVLHEKKLLLTKIKQTRNLQAGKTSNKKSFVKTSVFYRYRAELPPNYKPRTFDCNYIITDWKRCGHQRGVWVLKENAEILAEKHDATVNWASETNGKVKLILRIKPQDVHRKVGNPTLGRQSKIYS